MQYLFQIDDLLTTNKYGWDTKGTGMKKQTSL